MGKTLDELPDTLILDTTPAKGRPNPFERHTADPRSSRWYQFSSEIDDLLATGRYTWAEDTLRSIQETVQRTERVTEGQERAVRHIEQARQGSWGRGRSRRYY